MVEIRGTPRIKMSLKVISKIYKDLDQKFALAKGSSFKGDTFNISVLGMGISLKYFLPKGLVVELEIQGESFGLTGTMKLWGEVRYCKYMYKQGKLYKCGIKFLGIPKEYEQAIVKFSSTYEKGMDAGLKFSE